MAVLFGLFASLLIGVADYLGRSVTRRSAAITAVASGQAAGVVVALLLGFLAVGQPTTDALLLGATSGVLNGVAMVVMYRGMAAYSAGVVGPVVAVASTIVPVTFALATGDAPSPLTLAGIVFAVASLFLTSLAPHLGGRVGRAVAYGVCAGLLAGPAVTIIGSTDVASGMWPLVGQRAAAAAVLATLAATVGVEILVPSGLRRRGFAMGAIGTVGVACFVAGGQRGPLAPIAVAGALYPAVTAVLAVVFDDDRLRWWQLVGIIGSITGVAAIVVGSQ